MIPALIYIIFTFWFCQTYGVPVYELSDTLVEDMILSPQQELAISNRARNGLISDTYRWPHNNVLYRIEADDFTDEQINYIHLAMDQIEYVSCVRFVEADENATEFVEIIGSKPGCISMVGYRGKKQYINFEPNELEEGCFRLVAIMHEFLHTLGFFHMQSSPERDDYLIIVWENIRQGQKHNFKKINTSLVTSFDVQYDYKSIMQYPGVAFSKNGKPTMIPIDERIKLRRHRRLSKGDITKLNRMYDCYYDHDYDYDFYDYDDY